MAYCLFLILCWGLRVRNGTSGVTSSGSSVSGSLGFDESWDYERFAFIQYYDQGNYHCSENYQQYHWKIKMCVLFEMQCEFWFFFLDLPKLL